MYPSKIKAFSLAAVSLLAACVPNKAFVPAGFDPLTVEKKGDISVSASARPFKFDKAAITYMRLNNLAVRGGAYQCNHIHRHYSFEPASTGKTYSYDCEFFKSGLHLRH